ncbi:hypothetical protein BKA67DRAFT_10705 [Truncatella angustata]|uniref:Mid2 domain-containing protein n=1 Tax=Truncatella angustata TaxID=152316 RepID=A0A9P8UVX7_9PEZI|nr:uncharacterized protein BKA67DRAFT_10705 [Truncatella angustata]KAH6659322.1 hypothetical protein BKA67DRAFT_10705 [Truncatella angustata]KAH8199167.1 hypothetical protein TruAng_006698 [Truncatella angustata]
MRLSTNTLLALWTCAQGVFAFENKFLFPTEKDLTFYYMNTIEVKYQSNFSDPTLYIFCTKDDGKAEQKNKVSAPENNGTIAVTLDFTKVDTCWFNLRSDEKKNNLGFNSPNRWSFDYDEQKKNTTTVKAIETTTTKSSTPSSTFSTSSTSITTLTPAPVATTAEATTSTPTSISEPAQKGIQIGIGVGAAVGGLIVMTLIGMVAARMISNKKAKAGYTAPSEMTPAGVLKPLSSNMSYYPVSHSEPPVATLAGPYDPYHR